jgi:hypothetical protein
MYIAKHFPSIYTTALFSNLIEPIPTSCINNCEWIRDALY